MSYEIHGKWKIGWAIDLHTIKSVLLPDGRFDTTYTKTGEALHKLKYESDYSQIIPLAQTTIQFLNTRKVTPYLDVIISVPPSSARVLQPVHEIAKNISTSLNIPYDTNYLIKTRQTQPLKGLDDQTDRKKTIAGAFQVADLRYKNKKILLFDDLFRSGTTLNEITEVLHIEGLVQKVYVVTLTKTRVNK